MVLFYFGLRERNLSDKADFKTKSITRDKGGTFHNEKKINLPGKRNNFKCSCALITASKYTKYKPFFQQLTEQLDSPSKKIL